MSSESGRPFDPTPYLTDQRGRKHLDPRWRLLWLRSEHPDAEILPAEPASGDNWVRFRASVSIPGRGSATGHARASKEDFPTGWYEKAELGALGRALAYLGYGTQFATELEDEADTTAPPVEVPIEFPGPRPRPVREAAPTPTRVDSARTRSGSNWTEFWSTVREYKKQHPEFDEVAVFGRDPSKRMTAEEAMRRFREAMAEQGQES